MKGGAIVIDICVACFMLAQLGGDIPVIHEAAISAKKNDACGLD